MAKLSREKKNRILQTFKAANLGEDAVQGTGFRKKLYKAFKEGGAQGLLDRINKYRGNHGNQFGDIKYVGRDPLTLKRIRKSISEPEKLARGLDIPVESFDEQGARAGQEEMRQFFGARTADQLIPYNRSGEDLNTNESQFNEDIGTQQSGLDTNKLRFAQGISTDRSRFGEGLSTDRLRMAAAQSEAERGRALTESGENINQNNALASANTFNSPAANNLRKRLAEIQGLRTDQMNRQFTEQGQDINTREKYGNEDFSTREKYGNEDFGTQQKALDTSRTRGTLGFATGRARLGEDTTLFQKERERQLQELLGEDIAAKREKFYNQQSLPSSSLRLNARY